VSIRANDYSAERRHRDGSRATGLQFWACHAITAEAIAKARDELADRMLMLRQDCDEGDRRACVRLRILIGENRERRAAWRREHPEVFFYER
jgi:hypothetical protein